jgi:hypothetical protein
MSRPHKYLLLVMLIAVVAGCQPVRPYQRVYLNDHEMRHGQNGAQSFEESVQTYREGATGGGGSKTSGGCGCN